MSGATFSILGSIPRLGLHFPQSLSTLSRNGHFKPVPIASINALKNGWPTRIKLRTSMY